MNARRIGTLAGIFGPTIFVATFLLEGWLRPGYNPPSDYVSALSLGSRGWIQIANFVFVGLCLLAFAVAVAGEVENDAMLRAGPLILGVLGICYLLSGPFVMDPANTPSTSMSWHGITHGILGAIAFVLMPTACFVFVWRVGPEPGWRWFRLPTILLGSITAVADVIFTIGSKDPNLAIASMPWAGLLQRLVIVPFMAWIVVFAFGLLRRETKRRVPR